MTTIRSALLLLLMMWACESVAATLPAGFSESQVVTGLDPTTMAFTPGGSLFVCEKPGRLRLVTWNGSSYVLSTVVDLSAQVNATNERGLMSVAVDPSFNPGDGSPDYVYLYYTAAAPAAHNRVSRFTVAGGTASLASEVILIDFDNLPGDVHNGGALRFGQDGLLYVATGDGSNGGNGQSGTTLLGKLLRLNKDGSVPTDNPAYSASDPQKLGAIVGMGLRNPYTMAAQAGTNRLFVNDVGGGAWEEVNTYTTGASPVRVNYGWSTIEGKLAAQVPPTNYVDPVHVYDHGVGTAICGSAFYTPSAPGGLAFPPEYTNRYFFCDYGDYAANTGEIYWIDPTNPTTRTLFASAVNRPIAVEIAPDGALWYVARGNIVNGGPGSPEDNGSVGTGGSLYRVTYLGGGAATKVTFVQEPQDHDAGTTLEPAITVALRNDLDVIVNSTATVTLTLNSGTLSGTTSVAAVAGIATFSNLAINTPGIYTLTAASGALTTDTSASFTVRNDVSTPVIMPGTGTFSGPVTVQITCATPGAAIHYTTNNTAPTSGSPLYTGPFALATTATVRAIASKAGLDDSGEANAAMTITGVTPYGWPNRPPVGGVTMPATIGGVLPATLGATNLFSDLATLEAGPGFIPYAVNTALWSDGADKLRWVGLPGSKRITFAPTGEFTWPGGTIFIKHFALETNQLTATSRRLETRVLVLHASGGGGYGVTYRWNEAGTEATLVGADGLDEAIPVTDASGTHTQTWRYPSRTQCLQCHTQNAGFVLGPKTRQLNGTYDYPDYAPPAHPTDNQLRTWNYLRMFTVDIGEGSIVNLAKMVQVDDTSASLEKRARSYLDANCANCHRPGGAPANWDARYDTAMDDQRIIHGTLSNNLGNAANRVVIPQDTSRSVLHLRLTSTAPSLQMPPLARRVIDQTAMAAIAQWISSLPTGSGLKGDYRNENQGFATTPVLTRTDPQVAFTWAASPATGVNADQFTVRWSGSVVPRSTGDYTFSVVSDDGARLWVNNTQVLNQWVNQPPTEIVGTPITLTAGMRYDLTLEYFEATGGAEVTLLWTGPDQPRAVIPRYRLFPTAAAVVEPIPATPAAPGVTGNGSTAPTLSGSGTPGSTIRIFADGVEVGSTIVAGDGTWSFPLSGLPVGSHQITVTAGSTGGTSGTSPATTAAVGSGSGGSSGSSSSCGVGGSVAGLALFLMLLILRPLRWSTRP